MHADWRSALGLGAITASAILGAWLILRRGAAPRGDLTEPLRRVPAIEAVYGIGTVAANRRYLAISGVTAVVRELLVKEGDAVKRGSPLVRLDGVGTLIAPLSGVVTSVSHKENETVFPQSPILSVTDMRDRYVIVSLEQRAALRVRPGMPARMSVDTARDLALRGRVVSVYSNGSEFLARIAPGELPANILPGMNMDVAIVTREIPRALLAPLAAVAADRVWVSRDGARPILTTIVTGVADGPSIEIIGGDLREGDRVLIPSGGAP